MFLSTTSFSFDDELTFTQTDQTDSIDPTYNT